MKNAILPYVKSGHPGIYLVSPEVAAASALTGYITAPSEVCDCSVLENITEPAPFAIDDRLVVEPARRGDAESCWWSAGPRGRSGFKVRERSRSSSAAGSLEPAG